MTKDDNKLIWRALVEEANPDAGTYDAEGMEPGPMEELNPAYGEEESSGGCPNLDKLIASAESDEEDDDDTVVARQGRGETAAQFKAADDTEFG